MSRLIWVQPGAAESSPTSPRAHCSGQTPDLSCWSRPPSAVAGSRLLRRAVLIATTTETECRKLTPTNLALERPAWLQRGGRLVLVPPGIEHQIPNLVL